jgi:hypothetical protein
MKKRTLNIEPGCIFIAIALVLLTILLVLLTPCAAQVQDTIPVTISIDDTTYRPDIYYYIEGAYGEPDSEISNAYHEIVPGWMVDGQIVTLRFEPLPPNYIILNIGKRRYYTLTYDPRQEIQEPGSTTIIYSEQIYFQQPGHFKNK